MCTKVGMIIEFIELRQITAKFLKHYFVFNWNFSPWPYDDFLGAIKMTKMTYFDKIWSKHFCDSLDFWAAACRQKANIFDKKNIGTLLC